MNETTELILAQLNKKKVHAETHEVGGGDEIDALKLKNIGSITAKTISDPITGSMMVPGTVGATQIDPSLITSVDNVAVQMEFDKRGINVQKIGVKGDGATDDTTAIQAAYNTYDSIILPKGTYIVKGTILMNKIYKGRIHLMEGAVLKKPADADNMEPVVWMTGYGQVLSGESRWSCSIISEKASPYGVVRLGYKDMVTEPANFMAYNTIKSLNLLGSGILTSGSPNMLLYMASAELNGKFSYYHTVNEIIFRNANIGLLLEGFSNANNMSDLQFYSVGTNRSLEGASIKFKSTNAKYPLENNIHNVVQGGGSTGAYVLYFDGESLGNCITNIIGEPGGTTGNESIFAKVVGTDHRNNIIIGYANTRGGEGFDSTFLSKNTVMTGQNFANKSVSTTKHTTDELVIKNLNSQKSFSLGPLTENVAYEVARIPTADFANRAYFVEMTAITTYSGSAIPFFASQSKATWRIKKPVSGSLTVELDSLSTTETNVLVHPFENGTDIVFGVKVPNNGSGSTQVHAAVNLVVYGSQNGNATLDYTPKITPVTTLVTISSPTVYKAARNMIAFVGTTVNRPSSTVILTGQPYFDTTLGKPIWWNGTGWVDATGTTV